MKGGIITKPQTLFCHGNYDDYVIPFPGSKSLNKDKICVNQIEITPEMIERINKAINKFMAGRKRKHK